MESRSLEIVRPHFRGWRFFAVGVRLGVLSLLFRAVHQLRLVVVQLFEQRYLLLDGLNHAVVDLSLPVLPLKSYNWYLVQLQ